MDGDLKKMKIESRPNWGRNMMKKGGKLYGT